MKTVSVPIPPPDSKIIIKMEKTERKPLRDEYGGCYPNHQKETQKRKPDPKLNSQYNADETKFQGKLIPKVEKETSLSEKIQESAAFGSGEYQWMLYTKDVKEAVRKLKEAIPFNMPDDEYDNLINRMNQIFGEKLI